MLILIRLRSIDVCHNDMKVMIQPGKIRLYLSKDSLASLKTMINQGLI